MSGAPGRRISRAVLGNGLVLLALVLLATALVAWQPGPWWPGSPRPGRWIGAATSALLYLGLTSLIMCRSHAPRVQRVSMDPNSILVAHASQTGFAIELAMRTAQSLREGGAQVHVLSLGALNVTSLVACRRALFVVSTTGEGDPPDLALSFVQTVMRRTAALQQLQYAVLALGDSTYPQYCQFGHQLDAWLRRQGGTPLFERIDVDNADDTALRHWHRCLSLLVDHPDASDWRPPSYQAWTLRERRLLNPGSVGGPVYHLALTPPDSMPDWLAGDLVEICPRHAPEVVDHWLHRAGLAASTPVLVAQTPIPLGQVLASRQLPDRSALDVGAQSLADTLPGLAHREYSIASLPDEGALQLLLRRAQRSDGSPGLASGWLCEQVAVGAPIALRLRSNPNFHPPEPHTPLILIGNGTGIAGLRALLKARIAAGARRNWLLFGERQRAHDFYYRKELTDWQSQAWLERIDLAFSRDGTAPRYVQDALRTAATALRTWIEDGAAIYVCGSKEGMAQGVDRVLHDVLGEAALQALRMQARYRRDVY